MATNGFFGKLKAAFAGKKAPIRAVEIGRIHHDRRQPKPASTAHTRRTTKGAFGGTGTGRGMRGKPGRKLLKKTVKAGWKAQKRVMLSTKPVGIIGGHS